MGWAQSAVMVHQCVSLTPTLTLTLNLTLTLTLTLIGCQVPRCLCGPRHVDFREVLLGAKRHRHLPPFSLTPRRPPRSGLCPHHQRIEQP